MREHFAELGSEVLIMENSVYDDFRARIISISKIVNWEPTAREILIEGK